MFLKIKNIPKVNWSSEKTYNFKPRFSTLFFCCFGLMLFGLGEGLLIVSFTGASPWSVLAQGLSININLSVGMITFMLLQVCPFLTWKKEKQLRDTEPFLKSNFPPRTLFVF